MTTAPSVSVIVPAYNEAGSLEAVVRRLARVLSSLGPGSEVIIVNDGSADETGAIADRLRAELPYVRAIHHPHNRGYGAAQSSGFAAATAPLVCVLPADGQIAPEELPKYLAAAPRGDVVVGAYRARPEGLLRRVPSLGYRLVLRVLFGVRLRNINAPKLYRRAQLSDVELTSPGGFADAEIVIQLHQQGRRFCEVEIDCLPRVAGQSSTGRAAALKAIAELWRFYWRGVRRRFR